MAYDFLIIGSGIAGLYTALLLKDLGQTIMVSKGSLEECNTKYAQGGIAVPIGKGDSPQLHFQDTINTGAGLCDERMVWILVNEAIDRISDLIKFGVVFDSLGGEVMLAREGGHSLPRIIHAGGDATGERIELALGRLVRESSPVLEHHLAVKLLKDGNRVCGAKVLDLKESKFKEIEAGFTILATGGAGRLFKYTSNLEVATGDGVALAYEAGAQITDMEFFQFHPTALVLPGCPHFLISETVRGEGGVLKNTFGRPFMNDYSPQGDLAPRDIVTRAILSELRKTDSQYVYLDLTDFPAGKIATRFPQIYRFCLEHGLDIASQFIPVAPAAHYMIGGVRIDEWGRTSLPGLLASGEVACTGVHGANRLGSNSLLEVLVFAKRIREYLERDRIASPLSRKPDEKDLVLSLPERKPLSSLSLSLSRLAELMWQKAGIIRDKEGLEEVAGILSAWEGKIKEPSSGKDFELKSLVLVGRLLVEAALLREESRGVHFRADFPHTDPAWRKHIIFSKEWK